MPSYRIYRFQADSEKTEIAIALLQDLPFKGFEETSSGFEGFIPVADIDENTEDEILAVSNQLGIGFETEMIEDRNWNKAWEDQFQPVIIDKRVAIRAAFHPHFPDVEFELNIHPKMAFGTGHHETTTMMIQEMLGLNFEGKKVLDYGCGTGILGIFASKLKAVLIDGVDNEYPAYESTLENTQINNVHNMQVVLGTLTDIKAGNYDIILANINRNVILESLQSLVYKTSKGGILLFSGVLESDQNIMEDAFLSNHLQINHFRKMGQWLCFNCSKNF